MPATQTAVVDNYDFGLPALEGPVAVFRIRDNQGGKVEWLFENANGQNDVTMSIEVSPDNSAWAATTAANNLEAITDVAVPQKTNLSGTVLLRRGLDAFMRITGAGSARVVAQLRHNGILDIEDLSNAAPTA